MYRLVVYDQTKLKVVSGIKETRNYLAKNIYRLRKKKNWSQEQLAFESNTTNKCISDLELSKRNVKIDTVTRIAKALDVTVSDITKPID